MHLDILKNTVLRKKVQHQIPIKTLNDDRYGKKSVNRFFLHAKI